MDFSRINNWYNLKDRVIALTGATGKLGRFYTEILSELGANVVILDLDLDVCNQLAEQVAKKYATEPLAIALDVADKDQVISSFEQIADKYSRLDVLINNAAALQVTFVEGSLVEFEDFPIEVWQKNLDVNLTGAYLCSQQAGKQMIKHGTGCILNIGSVYGVVACDQRIYGNSKLNSSVAYATTKSGLVNFTRYLASYWQGKNIRVNCLSPGGVFNNQSEEFVQNYESRTMLKRMATPDDLGSALLYLVSDASRWVTGFNLVVDGGWTAW